MSRYLSTYNPWQWKPVPPETPEQTADRKQREKIAAEISTVVRVSDHPVRVS